MIIRELASLKDLQKEPKWKEINFQDKCEGGNSLGDLLLKHATENDNSRVKDFLLKNGCEPLQQEQITAAINEEEEAPNVEENRADSNEVDSSNCKNHGKKNLTLCVLLLLRIMPKKLS